MESCLLLNVTYEPLKVIDWRRAMTLWCQDKVEILEEHDKTVRAVSFSFKLPSVVRLLRFVKIRQRADYVPFTRANIFARDGHRCQYCGREFESEDLTYDHVVPASQGGRRTWENIVAACIPCNSEKDNRTPQQAGMMLKRAPKKPSSSPMLRISIGLRRTPENWRSYLYWNAELEA